MAEAMNTPMQIFKDYETGVTFKAGLGNKGIYEQSKVNERFFVGDQWHGAKTGNDRPLVRHNIIKRIGEYKMSVLSSSPVAVNFSADGIPNTLDLKKKIEKIRGELPQNPENNGAAREEIPTNEEVGLVMSALSDYYRVTAERLKFEEVKETALRNAYISGTGVIYTYWDPDVKTGLYADKSRKTPIMGDIACECLDIENIVFGDPNTDDIEKQPYIIISQRKSVGELRREAKRNGRNKADLESIQPDNDCSFSAGDRGETEPENTAKTTVLTKLWKEYNDDGSGYTVKAKRVVKGVVIRSEWDLGVRVYPLAKFSWERRRNCAYGESEITYLIPNQIAINRMITASVWAVMVMGMPIMVVNNDIVRKPISNDPGQIIRISGDANDVANSIRYVVPPSFSPNFDSNINSLIGNTLAQSGANDAALGNIRPDNTSAIIAVREAAMLPMQTVQNRYFQFCEDIARIWAEFWVTKYGSRAIKIEDQNGTWYLPFDGRRYKDLLISVRVDVGASTLWSESQNIKTLDNLFDRQVIDVMQYLERMPKGIIPDVTGLMKELQQKTQSAASVGDDAHIVPQITTKSDGQPPVAPQNDTKITTQNDEQGDINVRTILDSLSPELREKFLKLPKENQMEFLHKTLGATE